MESCHSQHKAENYYHYSIFSRLSLTMRLCTILCWERWFFWSVQLLFIIVFIFIISLMMAYISFLFYSRIVGICWFNITMLSRSGKRSYILVLCRTPCISFRIIIRLRNITIDAEELLYWDVIIFMYVPHVLFCKGIGTPVITRTRDLMTFHS